MPIHVGDADAIDALRDKIRRLEAKHDSFKRHNAEARKGTHTVTEQCPGCQLITAQGAYMQTDGIRLPGYVTTNNRGRIKQAKEQLAKAEYAAIRKATVNDQPPQPIASGPGWEINEAIDDDRVRIHFDDKPSADIRAIVKGHGFRWAPSQDAWQRQNTENCLFAARRAGSALLEAQVSA
jgi:hypothetical protein